MLASQEKLGAASPYLITKLKGISDNLPSHARISLYAALMRPLSQYNCDLRVIYHSLVYRTERNRLLCSNLSTNVSVLIAL